MFRLFINNKLYYHKIVSKLTRFILFFVSGYETNFYFYSLNYVGYE